MRPYAIENLEYVNFRLPNRCSTLVRTYVNGMIAKVRNAGMESPI
jgi:hypothetical protein